MTSREGVSILIKVWTFAGLPSAVGKQPIQVGAPGARASEGKAAGKLFSFSMHISNTGLWCIIMDWIADDLTLLFDSGNVHRWRLR
jgi:hypothetical protein